MSSAWTRVAGRVGWSRELVMTDIFVSFFVRVDRISPQGAACWSRGRCRGPAPCRSCRDGGRRFLPLGGEPGVEVDGPDARALARRQLAALELGAEVACVRVGDDRARVAGGGEQAPCPRVEGQR